MARKKKALAKKTTAKRGPGRPRKVQQDDVVKSKPVAKRKKAVQPLMATKADYRNLSERLSFHIDEAEMMDSDLKQTVERVDRLCSLVDDVGGVGHIHAAMTVHDKILEDIRIRLNDTLYRLEQLENRMKAGPGLLPVLVTQDSDVNKLSARTLAQVLLSRLVENDDPEAA